MDEHYGTAFDTIREGRSTNTGKALVDIARRIFNDGTASSEARQWIKLGLIADAASMPGELRRLQDLVAKRSRGKKGIGAMRKPLAVVGSGPA